MVSRRCWARALDARRHRCLPLNAYANLRKSPFSSSIFEILRNRIRKPLVLIDVGGHGGVIDQWKAFGDKARSFCFEARDDDANGLIAGNTDANVEYVPLALSDSNEPLEINVTAVPACSSVYPPIPQMFRHYPHITLTRPVSKARCLATTLDEFLAKRGIESAHGIKLDTQGFELRVLKGAERALRDCQFILVEVEFNPLYEGQPLFADVDRFLRERGFVLWRLGNLAHYATEQVGGEQHHMLIGSVPGEQRHIPVTNGQLFWADAFYVRREATAAVDTVLDRDAAIAAAALSSQFRFYDAALEMIRKSGDAELMAELRAAMGLEFVATAKERFSAGDFFSQSLSFTADQWETDFSTTDACIVYGPYTRLPQGDFEVIFQVSDNGDTRSPLQSPIELDVAADMVVQNSITLIGSEGRDALSRGEIMLSFFNSQPKATFEFRITTYGKPFDGKLVFSGVTLHRK